jgi:hypothetical protein
LASLPVEAHTGKEPLVSREDTLSIDYESNISPVDNIGLILFHLCSFIFAYLEHTNRLVFEKTSFFLMLKKEGDYFYWLEYQKYTLDALTWRLSRASH